MNRGYLRAYLSLDFGFLSSCRNRVETNESEEYDTCTADHATPAMPEEIGIRILGAVRQCCRFSVSRDHIWCMVSRVDIQPTNSNKHQYDRHFDDNKKKKNRSRLLRTFDQQCRKQDKYNQSRNINHTMMVYSVYYS